MAEGIVACVLDSGILQPEQIMASDTAAERRRLFSERFRIETTADNLAVLRQCRRILLAIKPQTFHQIADDLAAGAADRLFISIMAGIPTHLIEQKLGGQVRVVRVMPNLPIRVGAGVAALYRGRFATDEDLHFARLIFEAGGRAIVVESEDLIDAVTAVSGSGPAYFYYFVEAIAEAGQACGLPADQALLLAEYACLGAAKMMTETGEHPAELRRKVTSPGGTTQAAVEYMEGAKVREHIKNAVIRAYERARELAGK